MEKRLKYGSMADFGRKAKSNMVWLSTIQAWIHEVGQKEYLTNKAFPCVYSPVKYTARGREVCSAAYGKTLVELRGELGTLLLLFTLYTTAPCTG